MKLMEIEIRADDDTSVDFNKKFINPMMFKSLSISEKGNLKINGCICNIAIIEPFGHLLIKGSIDEIMAKFEEATK